MTLYLRRLQQLQIDRYDRLASLCLLTYVWDPLLSSLVVLHTDRVYRVRFYPNTRKLCTKLLGWIPMEEATIFQTMCHCIQVWLMLEVKACAL